jgi:hypothetical protein
MKYGINKNISPETLNSSLLIRCKISPIKKDKTEKENK